MVADLKWVNECGECMRELTGQELSKERPVWYEEKLLLEKYTA